MIVEKITFKYTDGSKGHDIKFIDNHANKYLVIECNNKEDALSFQEELGKLLRKYTIEAVILK